MGNHLDKPMTTKDSHDATLNGLSYAASAMQGWRVNMEDTHCAHVITIGGQSATLVCVFDGHGGDLVAIEAAKRIKPTLETALTDCNILDPQSIGETMQEAMLSLDDELKHMAAVQNGTDKSGCTAIVAILTDTHIIVANAGDARGILVQGDSSVRPMSFDHKPMNPEETARIEAAGGYVSSRRVNGDLAVSRALGDFTYKQADSVPAKDQSVTAFPDIEITERDGTDQFLLLACDGIWDVMTNDEAGAFVKEHVEGGYKGEPMSKVLERLLNKCLEKSSMDNMTAAMVVFSGITPGENEKPPEAIFKEMEANGMDMNKTQRL